MSSDLAAPAPGQGAETEHVELDGHDHSSCHAPVQDKLDRPQGGQDARKRILIGLFGVVAFAWGLTILAGTLAADTNGRTLAALQAVGGHGQALASGVGSGGLPLWVALVLTIVSWVVMTAAMMLPSSVAMLTMYAATARRSPQWKRSFSSFVGGYFVIWTGFGVAAFAFSLGVAALADQWGWLADNWKVVPAAALAAAALWQLTPLKDACLKECRHPLSFMMANFRRSGPKPSFVLGLKHGMHCFGCCWALMLVMVFFGSAHVAAMGALALIMLVEKAAPWGDRVVRPIGIALALAAVATLFLGTGAHNHLA